MRTAREFLTSMAVFLTDESVPREERRKVLNVVSALRGPDSGDTRLKHKTTARIRRDLLDLSGRKWRDSHMDLYTADDSSCRAFFLSWVISVDDEEIASVAQEDRECFAHFETHVRLAKAALASIARENE